MLSNAAVAGSLLASPSAHSAHRTTPTHHRKPTTSCHSGRAGLTRSRTCKGCARAITPRRPRVNNGHELNPTKRNKCRYLPVCVATETAQIECKHCGSLFAVARKRGARRKFCSVACGRRHRSPHGRVRADLASSRCVVCGNSLAAFAMPARGGFQKYCSVACRKQRAKPPVHPCVRCGTTVRRKRISGMCVGCARGAESKAPRACVICGSLFVPKWRNEQRSCSGRCAELLRGAHMVERFGPGKVTRQCEGCAQPFTRKRNKNRHAGRFCSRECYWNWRNGKHVRWVSDRAPVDANLGTRRRQARIRATGGKRSNRLRVCERDGWRCQLCGISTPRVASGTGRPDAPHMDHIVPLAAGGADTDDNAQCLCRRCNVRKGARTRGQLRLQLGDAGALTIGTSSGIGATVISG